MIVQCTNCNQDLRIADDQILEEGTPVECPQCQTVFVTRPDGGTSQVDAPPASGPSGADDDPDAGFQLPISDAPDPPEETSPEAAHTHASREDVPQGRPAQVSDDDDGDFDLISQLGIKLSDEPSAEVANLELSLDDEIATPPAPAVPPPAPAEPPPAPAPPAAAATPEPVPPPEDDLDFELDDDSFSPDQFPADEAPDALVMTDLTDEDSIFGPKETETPAERERSLDDIFAEDDAAALGTAIEAPPALADLPPLEDNSVEPGGEIAGNFTEATSAEAPPPPPPRATTTPTGPTAHPGGPMVGTQKKRSGIPGWLIAILLLIMIGGAGGAWMVSKGGNDPRGFLDVLVTEIRSLVHDTGPPALPLPNLAIDEPTGARETTTDGAVFAIRGRVRNSSDFSAYVISLEAEVLDGDGRVVGRSNSFAANTVSKAKLAELSRAEVRAILDREIGEGGNNVRVQPGDSLPFLIVIDRIPAGDLSFGGIRATSRLPDAAAGSDTPG